MYNIYQDFELSTASQTSSSPSKEDRNSKDNANPSNKLSINHFWDLCDLFEENEEPNVEEVQIPQHTHKTGSKGSVAQTNPSVRINTSDALESSQRNNAPDKTVATNKIVNKKSSPINKDDSLELVLSILEDLERTQASISLFELGKIAQFHNEIINALPGKMPKIP